MPAFCLAVGSACPWGRPCHPFWLVMPRGSHTLQMVRGLWEGRPEPFCGTIMILQHEDSTLVQHSSCSEKFDLHQRLVTFILLKMSFTVGSEKCCDVTWHNPRSTASSENLCSKSALQYFWKLHCEVSCALELHGVSCLTLLYWRMLSSFKLILV